MCKQLHFFVNLNPGLGIHPARWRFGDPAAFFHLDGYLNIARVAERGLLDALFASDYQALTHDYRHQPWHVIEPTVAVAALAAQTSNIGLVSTLSTTYNEPYNIARRVASIDHLSGGRAAWNIVTTPLNIIAANYDSKAPLPNHDQRYSRAEEFTEVVLKLWDSWESQAFVGDPRTGRFTDPGKVWPIDHQGEHFSVAGPFQVPRTPQGRPVLVQAGQSPQGRAFAARHAEVIFVLHSLYEEARISYAQIKANVRAAGRDPDHVKVMPGVWTLIGSSHEEALRLRDELDQYRDYEYEIGLMAGRLGLQLDIDDLHRPLRELLGRKGTRSEGPSGLHVDAERFAGANPDLTLREYINASGASIRQLLGSPEEVADDLEKWFLGGAADGFNLSFSHFPDQLEVFVDQVVPLLQKRGLFRTHYEGPTLRDLLGLDVPANRHEQARTPHPLQGSAG
jgi:FMN-dependent oxidoreductase (nitrilotriacetate monooxygenase family)